ncbi:MAG: hypothetical protein ABI651_11710 [Verrucomicrobiota bacterium]
MVKSTATQKWEYVKQLRCPKFPYEAILTYVAKKATAAGQRFDNQKWLEHV